MLSPMNYLLPCASAAAVATSFVAFAAFAEGCEGGELSRAATGAGVASRGTGPLGNGGRATVPDWVFAVELAMPVPAAVFRGAGAPP